MDTLIRLILSVPFGVIVAVELYGLFCKYSRFCANANNAPAGVLFFWMLMFILPLVFFILFSVIFNSLKGVPIKELGTNAKIITLLFLLLIAVLVVFWIFKFLSSLGG